MVLWIYALNAKLNPSKRCRFPCPPLRPSWELPFGFGSQTPWERWERWGGEPKNYDDLRRTFQMFWAKRRSNVIYLHSPNKFKGQLPIPYSTILLWYICTHTYTHIHTYILYTYIHLHMGMDQYLLIPFLGGWTSIYQLLPAILMFTRGTRFWHTAIYTYTIYTDPCSSTSPQPQNRSAPGPPVSVPVIRSIRVRTTRSSKPGRGSLLFWYRIPNFYSHLALLFCLFGAL